MPDCCRAGTLLSSGTGVGRMRGGPSNGLEDCSSEFRHRRGRPERPEELAYHRTILFSGLSTTTDWRFEEDGRELRVRIGPSLATNSGEVAIEHARAGGGLPCALGYQVRDLVRSGELEIVLSRFEPPASPIQAVYPSARFLAARVRALIDTEAPVGLRGH